MYARGNDKQNVFIDTKDRLRWERLLHEGLQQYNHQAHAYCWMTNHVHAVIQAGEKPISRFVGSLLSRYAKYFNKKTGRTGHVFERRHGELLVNDDRYLLELVRYIHQNPLNAGMVKQIDDYRWCSHHTYLGTRRTPWLITDKVLSIFGLDRRSAIRQYVDFVYEKQPAEVIEQIERGSAIDQRALGDDAWLREVLRRWEAEPEFENLDQLIGEVCRRNCITETQLASRSRSHLNARLRAEIARVAMDLGLATMTEIARRFGRSPPTLSNAVARLRNKSFSK